MALNDIQGIQILNKGKKLYSLGEKTLKDTEAHIVSLSIFCKGIKERLH